MYSVPGLAGSFGTVFHRLERDIYREFESTPIYPSGAPSDSFLECGSIPCPSVTILLSSSPSTG